MPSRSAHRRIGRQAALLAVMIGAGWGCAQIIGADFDKPLSPGETGGNMPSGGAGGLGGNMPSESSGGLGGNLSSASASGTDGATTSASSSGSGGVDAGCIKQSVDDTDCGPTGKDADCDGVVGDCKTKRLYVWMKGAQSSCGVADEALITDQKGNPGGSFYLVAEFSVFNTLLPGTTALYNCGAAGDAKAVISASHPCPGSPPPKGIVLGYVSNMFANGYERLSQATVNNGAIVVTPASAQMGTPCCHATPACDSIEYYVLPK